MIDAAMVLWENDEEHGEGTMFYSNGEMERVKRYKGEIVGKLDCEK